MDSITVKNNCYWLPVHGSEAYNWFSPKDVCPKRWQCLRDHPHRHSDVVASLRKDVQKSLAATQLASLSHPTKGLFDHARSIIKPWLLWWRCVGPSQRHSRLRQKCKFHCALYSLFYTNRQKDCHAGIKWVRKMKNALLRQSVARRLSSVNWHLSNVNAEHKVHGSVSTNGICPPFMPGLLTISSILASAITIWCRKADLMELETDFLANGNF